MAIQHTMIFMLCATLGTLQGGEIYTRTFHQMETGFAAVRVLFPAGRGKEYATQAALLSRCEVLLNEVRKHPGDKSKFAALQTAYQRVETAAKPYKSTLEVSKGGKKNK